MSGVPGASAIAEALGQAPCASAAVDIPTLAAPSGGDGEGSVASSYGSLDYSQLKKRKKPKGPLSDFEAKYRLTGEIIGRGASSIVQGCKDRATGIEYVVKTVDIRASPQGFWDKEQCQREHDILKVCRGNPNIVQLIDYYASEKRVYFVLERCNGGALFDRVVSRGSLTEYEASQVIADIAAALVFCHSHGIAHRDLKPQNVLCVSETDIVPVKITDFNLSNSSQTVTTPPLKTPVGTPEYWAPEVIDSIHDPSHTYDKRCDIWSLGCLLYMLLCGHPPFVGGCGPDCGWNAGNGCEFCQDSLQERIQLGQFDFDAPEWRGISNSAKDLIRGMLCTDVSRRLTAESVAAHPWFRFAALAPQTPLMSPAVFSRGSMLAYARFATEVNAMNRQSDDDALLGSFGSGHTTSLGNSGNSLSEYGPAPAGAALPARPPVSLSNGGSLGLGPPTPADTAPFESGTASAGSLSSPSAPSTAPVTPLALSVLRPGSALGMEARSGGSSQRASDVSDDGSDALRLSVEGLSLSKSSIISRRAKKNGRRRSSGASSALSSLPPSVDAQGGAALSYMESNLLRPREHRDGLSSVSAMSIESDVSPETDSLASLSPTLRSSRELRDASASSVLSDPRFPSLKPRMSEDEMQFAFD